MRKLWSRRWFQVAFAGTITLGVTFLLACGQYRVWSFRDYTLYRILTKDYSIGPDLWFGRIAPGQDVEPLIAQSDPYRVARYGPWVELTYYPGSPLPLPGLPFEGVTVLARDGQLVQAVAWSCTWQRVFFDTLSADESAEWQKATQDYVRSQLNE
jgi:hypothetical protein